MNKYNELYNAMVTAMKTKDTVERDVLRAVIANIKKTAIDQGCKDNYTDDICNSVLLKEKKTLEEMYHSCPYERRELIIEYKNKLEVINKFVPHLIDDEYEVENLIRDVCDEISFNTSNRGLIMRTISSSLKGKIDMKVANDVVTKLINGGNN